MGIQDARKEGNKILQSIGQSTITDDEALFLPETDELEAVLNALVKILNSRGAQGGAIKKLNAFALTRDIDLNAKKDIKSNIFIGASLE